MIELIEAQRAVARCNMCNEARELSLGSLSVRTVDASTALIALGPCPCGAVEFLIRAPRAEHPVPGSDSHKHQLLVDHLHAVLVSRKQIAKGSQDPERLCPPVDKEVLAKWFPHGLRRGATDREDEVEP